MYHTFGRASGSCYTATATAHATLRECHTMLGKSFTVPPTALTLHRASIPPWTSQGIFFSIHAAAMQGDRLCLVRPRASIADGLKSLSKWRLGVKRNVSSCVRMFCLEFGFFL